MKLLLNRRRKQLVPEVVPAVTTCILTEKELPTVDLRLKDLQVGGEDLPLCLDAEARLLGMCIFALQHGHSLERIHLLLPGGEKVEVFMKQSLTAEVDGQMVKTGFGKHSYYSFAANGPWANTLIENSESQRIEYREFGRNWSHASWFWTRGNEAALSSLDASKADEEKITLAQLYAWAFQELQVGERQWHVLFQRTLAALIARGQL